MSQTKHVKGWTQDSHYMHIGGQCGQSCPCCRAKIEESDLGVCLICRKKPKTNISDFISTIEHQGQKTFETITSTKDFNIMKLE